MSTTFNITLSDVPNSRNAIQASVQQADEFGSFDLMEGNDAAIQQLSADLNEACESFLTKTSIADFATGHSIDFWTAAERVVATLAQHYVTTAQTLIVTNADNVTDLEGRYRPSKTAGTTPCELPELTISILQGGQVLVVAPVIVTVSDQRAVSGERDWTEVAAALKENVEGSLELLTDISKDFPSEFDPTLADIVWETLDKFSVRKNRTRITIMTHIDTTDSMSDNDGQVDQEELGGCL